MTSNPTLARLKDKPHYSYSALNTFINVCQLQYYYRYIEKLEAETTSVALPFGTAFHQVLSEQAQAARSGRLLTPEQMTEAFCTYFKANCDDAGRIVFRKDETMDDQYATAGRMFRAVAKEWLDYYNIQSVAEAFSITMPNLSKPLIGELDMVVTETHPFDEEPRAYPIVVDFKTAARMWPEDKPDKDLQATVFSYAFDRVHGEIPSFRFDVVTKAKQPTIRHFRTSRNEKSFARLEKLFSTADKAINSGLFIPNETSFACADCPYAGACKSWHCRNSATTVDMRETA